jgi:hypothetical protein
LLLLTPALFLAAALVPVADAQPETPVPEVYLIRSWVIGAAGAPGSSANHRTNGTLCQPTPTGVGTGGDLVLYAGFWKGWMQGVVSVAPSVSPPFVTALLGITPNPFNATTAVHFSLAREAPVEIRVFDVSGRLVRTLTSGHSPPGVHRVIWDARSDAGIRAPSGTYFCRLTSNSFSSVRKLLIVR